MRARLLSIVRPTVVSALAALAALSSSCATTSGAAEKIRLKPSELDAQLSSLDGAESLEQERYRIEFEKIGIEQYDTFLLSAVRTLMPVALAEVGLEKLDQLALGLAGQPAGPIDDHEVLGRAIAARHSELTEEQLTEFRNHVFVIDALLDKLKTVPVRAVELGIEGKDLVARAQADTMKNPFGTMSASKEVSAAMVRLSAAGSDEVKAVTERALKSFKTLAVCSCTNDEATLKPADISEQLAAAYPEDTFQAGDARVRYVVTNVSELDGTFRDVARLRGLVVLTRIWTDETGATVAEITGRERPTSLDELKKALASIQRTKLKGNTVAKAKLKKHLEQVEALNSELAKMPEAGQALATKLQEAAPIVADAAAKAPARTAGLGAAVATTLQQSQGTVEEGAKAAAKLKALITPLRALAG